MKRVLFLAFCWSCAALGADVDALLKKGDALDRQFKNQDALGVFLEAEKAAPKDPEVLRRIAKEYAELVFDVPESEKRATAEKSVEYAERAVVLAPRNAKAQLSLAICYARAAGVVDAKTKIAYSKLIQAHARIALELDPNDDLTHFVLGAWSYEMANLNMALRAIARVVYGALPTASNEDAFKYLQKAVALNPRRIASYHKLGQTYLELKQPEDAKKCFEKVLSLPVRDKGDDLLKAEAKKLMP